MDLSWDIIYLFRDYIIDNELLRTGDRTLVISEVDVSEEIGDALNVFCECVRPNAKSIIDLDRKFDAALLLNALPKIEDWIGTMRSICACLADDGRAITIQPRELDVSYYDRSVIHFISPLSMYRAFDRIGLGLAALDGFLKFYIAAGIKGSEHLVRPRILRWDVECRDAFRKLVELGVRAVPVGTVAVRGYVIFDLDFQVIESSRRPREVAEELNRAFDFPIDLIFIRERVMAKSRHGIGGRRTYVRHAISPYEISPNVNVYELDKYYENLLRVFT